MRLLPLTVSLALAGLGLATAPPAKKPAAPPAKPAQPVAGKPSPVKGDPYSIAVPVDASAASASAAQTKAINSGRAKAWADISHRMVPQKDWGKLPNLDDPALERLIRGYTVADEKRSTTRYTARVTYIFNPAAVRHLLRVANIGVSEQGGTSILLLAMAPTYNATSTWAQAVAHAKPSGAQFTLVTPVGDNVDQSELGPLRFADANWGRVQAAASRVHANDAVVLQATNPSASHMYVHMRRIGPGRSFALPDIDVPVAAGTPPARLYATAADLATAAIEDAWKNRGTVDQNKKSRMVAEVRIGSLQQWSSLLGRLATVPAVSDVSVVAMNIGEGRLAISYTGTAEQLRAAAAQSSLTFAEREGQWWISPGRPANEDTGTE
ncbi:MAG TPA: DUF2066 domain-containing protein [Rhizomicrobium sp.]